MKNLFYFLIGVGLGILIGGEIVKYYTIRNDEVRIQLLIEALQNKPTHLHIHPLVPFPVPVPRDEPLDEQNVI